MQLHFARNFPFLFNLCGKPSITLNPFIINFFSEDIKNSAPSQGRSYRRRREGNRFKGRGKGA